MKLVVGIDVSKDEFHACLKESRESGEVRIKRTHAFPNHYTGFKEFLCRSVKDNPAVAIRFVMEATGSYYEDLAYFLYDNAQQVSVVLANRIKYYAKSMNVKTKTDKVDAGVIAGYGLEKTLSVWQPMSACYRELRDLCRELSSVRQANSRAKCQLHAMEHSHGKNAMVLKIKKEEIAFYQSTVKDMEKEITRLVDEDRALKEKVEKLVTIKGVRLITAVTVLCETNGFREFSNIRQVVSYAGLDVQCRESGLYRGKSRISKKGNARIRECLFMPALSACTHNKPVKALYERVVEKNPGCKRKGVVAGMRKLLVLLFVLWKKEEAYDENYRWGKPQPAA